MNQLVIPSLIFFFILITCLFDIVLILLGEFCLMGHDSWSLMGVNGLKGEDNENNRYVSSKRLVQGRVKKIWILMLGCRGLKVVTGKYGIWCESFMDKMQLKCCIKLFDLTD